jgi:WD40-like Beta Propeller Repeat
MHSPSRPARGLALLLLALGCAHSDPFTTGDGEARGPRDPTPPVRLTYNAGQDRAPTWLPDGSGLLYVFQRIDQPDFDQCLGLLPPAGGSRLATKCIPGDPGHDSVNIMEIAAQSPGGRLAWVEQLALPFASFAGGSIRVGKLPTADRGTIEQSLPYVAPGGNVHVTATHLAWLDENTLVYVGSDVAISSPCSGCPQDTLVAGRDIARLGLTTSPATISLVPGTTTATSVWPTADGSALYYTLGGGSEVLRLDLSSGLVDHIQDFGTLGIVRDVAVEGSSLVAVVGGDVSFGTRSDLPQFGVFQIDHGGTLYHVDLASGRMTVLSNSSMVVRHPTLSRDGRRIVAEVSPLGGPLNPDLYLFMAP